LHVAGGKRERPKKDNQAKMGVEGEDVLAAGEDGKLRLQLPSRFGAGTVKGAAWKVRGHRQKRVWV
jgi:hypothetical protein